MKVVYPSELAGWRAGSFGIATALAGIEESYPQIGEVEFKLIFFRNSLDTSKIYLYIICMNKKRILITIPVPLQLRNSFKEFAKKKNSDMSQEIRKFMNESVRLRTPPPRAKPGG